MTTAPTPTPAAPAPALPKPALLLVAALAIGLTMGLVFLGFEWVVNHGTSFVWDDVFSTNTTRWVVIPLAIALSIVFAVLLKLLRQDRILPIELDLMAHANTPPVPTTLVDIGTILLIGAASLLAGASLGPEAALVATSMALGAWVSFRFGMGVAAELLVLSSITALLVAFFGSLIPLLIPPLIMYQKTKQVQPKLLLPPVLAGLASYGVVYLIRGQVAGYGSIPASTDTGVKDFLTAAGLGLLGVGVGVALRGSIRHLAPVTKRIGDGVPWFVAAAVFGTGIGVLYFLGGETVQFSGSEGTKLLLADPTQYGAWALAGIVVVKVLVTAWSLTTGYRGGLVFPSVFAGIALSLCIGTIASGLDGPGLMVGGVAGILTEMTSPALGVIMLLSLLPTSLIPLGLAGAAGAIAGRLCASRLAPKTAAGPA